MSNKNQLEVRMESSSSSGSDSGESVTSQGKEKPPICLDAPGGARPRNNTPVVQLRPGALTSSQSRDDLDLLGFGLDNPQPKSILRNRDPLWSQDSERMSREDVDEERRQLQGEREQLRAEREELAQRAAYLAEEQAEAGSRRGRNTIRNDEDRASSRSPSDDREMDMSLPDDGISGTFWPLMAAIRVALDPERFGKKERRAFSKFVMDEAHVPLIKGRFRKEMVDQVEFAEPYDAEMNLEARLKHMAAVSPSTIRDFQKEIRAAYPNLLSHSSKDLGGFLNFFISVANTSDIRLSQLEKLFPFFFESPLKAQIAQEMEQEGLSAVIADLRQYVCHSPTVSQALEKYHAFKLDPNDIKYSMYTLKGLINALNPEAPQAIRDTMVRTKVEGLLPMSIQRLSRAKNFEYRKAHGGTKEYPFKAWKSDLLLIVSQQANQNQKKVNSIKQQASPTQSLAVMGVHGEDNERLLEEASLRRKVELLEQQQAKLLQDDTLSDEQLERLLVRVVSRTQPEIVVKEPPKVLFPPPGAGGPSMQDIEKRIDSAIAEFSAKKTNSNKRKGKPVPSSGDDLAAAKRQHKHSQLVKDINNFPDNLRQKLPYKVVNGVMTPEIPIVQVPGHPVFMTFLASSTHVISNAIINHFRFRCTSCGMVGHSAIHPDCPYVNEAPTWDVCTRCCCGFHDPAACIIDMANNWVVPNRDQPNKNKA